MELMRLMPHGLVLVFARKTSSPPNTFRWRGEQGMLISSFNSLTTCPEPHISFNVRLPSSTFTEINETGLFVVVAVSNSKVAVAFTKPWKDRSIIFENLMSKKTPEPFTPQGVVWWMRCEMMRQHCVEVGDHMIVVGRVIAQGTYDRVDRQEALVYSNGKYRLLGDSVIPESDALLIPNLLPINRVEISQEKEHVASPKIQTADPKKKVLRPEPLQQDLQDLNWGDGKAENLAAKFTAIKQDLRRCMGEVIIANKERCSRKEGSMVEGSSGHLKHGLFRVDDDLKSSTGGQGLRNPNLRTDVAELLRSLPRTEVLVLPTGPRVLPHPLVTSSFTCVSLDVPHISFIVKVNSEVWAEIYEYKTFNIVAFASALLGDFFTKYTVDQATTALSMLEPGTMIPKEGVGAMWWMKCVMSEHFKVRDHVIVIGRVFDTGRHQFWRDENLIVRTRHNYHKVGPIVTPLDDTIFGMQRLRRTERQDSGSGGILFLQALVESIPDPDVRDQCLRRYLARREQMRKYRREAAAAEKINESKEEACDAHVLRTNGFEAALERIEHRWKLTGQKPKALEKALAAINPPKKVTLSSAVSNLLEIVKGQDPKRDGKDGEARSNGGGWAVQLEDQILREESATSRQNGDLVRSSNRSENDEADEEEDEEGEGAQEEDHSDLADRSRKDQ